MATTSRDANSGFRCHQLAVKLRWRAGLGTALAQPLQQQADADHHTQGDYLDATGGLWLAQVGHGRREIAEAATTQMRRREYFMSFWEFSNERTIELVADHQTRTPLAAQQPPQDVIRRETGGSSVTAATTWSSRRR